MQGKLNYSLMRAEIILPYQKGNTCISLLLNIIHVYALGYNCRMVLELSFVNVGI